MSNKKSNAFKGISRAIEYSSISCIIMVSVTANFSLVLFLFYGM
jgi:hypothetical protein